MFSKTALFALFSTIVAQLHAPVGEPNGNPIYRPLNEIVPAGKPFTITWEPTTPNTVSILLLRGPSTNVVPIGAPIAQGIANSGTFQWTPATSLEADVTHYGIQLIDDVTGQYQYSTQFGISNDAPVEESSTPVNTPTATVTASVTGGSDEGYPVSTKTPESTKAPEYPEYPVSSSIATAVTPPAVGTTSHIIISTGAPGYNSSVIQPTKPLSIPSSLRTSATGVANSTVTPPAESTGGASSLQAGLSFVGLVAGLAYAL